MRVRALLVVFALVVAALPLSAAGTVTMTSANDTPGATHYTIAWTSTAGGAVSANPLNGG